MKKIKLFLLISLLGCIVFSCDGRRDFPPLKETGVHLDNPEVFLFPGDTAEIQPTFEPENINPEMEYSWQVKDPELVDFETNDDYSVLITPEETGETTIKILSETNDTISAEAHLIVKSSDPVDITNHATLEVSEENDGGSDADEGSSKLIDDDLHTKFLVDFDSPLSLTLEFEEPEVVNIYALTSGNDASERDPKDWELTGSNDGEDWETLDKREDQSFNERNLTREFTFKNNSEFKYYRISVTENNGGGLFQMSEWQLFSFPD